MIKRLAYGVLKPIKLHSICEIVRVKKTPGKRAAQQET